MVSLLVFGAVAHEWVKERERRLWSEIELYAEKTRVKYRVNKSIGDFTHEYQDELLATHHKNCRKLSDELIEQLKHKRAELCGQHGHKAFKKSIRDSFRFQFERARAEYLVAAEEGDVAITGYTQQFLTGGDQERLKGAEQAVPPKSDHAGG